MAADADTAPSDDIWRWTSAQTSPWSERCPLPMIADSLTDFLRIDLSFDDEWLPLEPKWADLYRQRPCSTQLTGIFVLPPAATSTEVFNTRFCFAPRSSSPSMKRTRESPLFS